MDCQNCSRRNESADEAAGGKIYECSVPIKSGYQWTLSKTRNLCKILIQPFKPNSPPRLPPSKVRNTHAPLTIARQTPVIEHNNKRLRRKAQSQEDSFGDGLVDMFKKLNIGDAQEGAELQPNIGAIEMVPNEGDSALKRQVVDLQKENKKLQAEIRKTEEHNFKMASGNDRNSVLKAVLDYQDEIKKLQGEMLEMQEETHDLQNRNNSLTDQLLKS